MRLYFSGVHGSWEARTLVKAGVDSYLADPTDWKNLPQAPHRALDSGAYRAFKAGKTVNPDGYVELVRTLGPLDFAIMPDVIGDFDETYRRWHLVRKRGPFIPVWGWGAPVKYLEEYLADARIVCIGGLVPLMREKNQAVLDGLIDLCGRFPMRFHLLGLNWLKAIEILRPTALSADTSKFLDAARYGHVIFVNTRTGHLSQAPARALKLDWDRDRRSVESARAMNEFCNKG